MRRRALAMLVVLALLLHAALLVGTGRTTSGPTRAIVTTAGPSMSVRVVDAAVPTIVAVAAATESNLVTTVPPQAFKEVALRVDAGRATPATAPTTLKTLRLAAIPIEASAAPRAEIAPVETAPVTIASATTANAETTSPAPAPSPAPTTASSIAPSPSAPAVASPASFLAPGESPPPTYRTALPPSATMHYELQRGLIRGTGEIRWTRAGDSYEVHLEAKVAGLTLLAQTSQGKVDATGLAPVRFVDQRVRRAAQSVNFRRDDDTISFSGPQTVWPLLAGTQDQLSWMIQLAGIVAAQPSHASDDGRIAMVVVGARGDASVRTLRFVGREPVETRSGTVTALKFMSASRSAYDATEEIWLDPTHGYLPVRATRKSGSGDAEFDLVLDRFEPGS